MSDTRENALVVSHVHKTFRLPKEHYSGLKQLILTLFKRNKQKGYELQHVLKGVSFEIKKGEFFGIVGRNGSGKSTLLKTIAGIYTPDKGHVQVNGKLVPFIELGVGFNPELTGRENVFLNGALLGFSRAEMDTMYDDIVDFAELGRFMDQKLKNYSSGMQVRLAFSVAIRAQGDILLLDEVLAVGDEAFQKKCYSYFNELKKQKKTVILVTHDMSAVERFCDRAILLEKGEVNDEGDEDKIAQSYRKLFQSDVKVSKKEEEEVVRTFPKKTIIFAHSDVPLTKDRTVVGGGMRAWGIATGLAANGVDVTLAYHDKFKKDDDPTEKLGVKLVNWNEDDASDLVESYGSVVLPYHHPTFAKKIIKRLEENQQLIFDCNVPFYTEVSARRSKTNAKQEYSDFMNLVEPIRTIFQRADLFICSGDAQQTYYEGVISSAGRINPLTYEDKLVIQTPFGISDTKAEAGAEPIDTILKEKGRPKNTKKLLWFGGIYPWFNMNTLIDSIAKINESTPVELVIVGANNPTVDQTEFTKRYEEMISYLNASKAKAYVTLQDWVPFVERADWYLNADAVIMINEDGLESKYSWRTRAVDYVWGGLPILTNGIDGVSELLIKNDAAIKIPDTTNVKALSSFLNSTLVDAKLLKTTKEKLAEIKDSFTWNTSTQELSERLKKSTVASDRKKN